MRRTNPLRAFLKDRRGASAVMMCVAMPVLVGGAGLGAEAAFWQFRQRAIQQQADAAAFAGATELRNGGSYNDVHAQVGSSLGNNGFRTDLGSYEVQTPPVSGPSRRTTMCSAARKAETVNRLFHSGCPARIRHANPCFDSRR